MYACIYGALKYLCMYVCIMQQEKEEETVKKVAASEHPLYSKFFKMLKVTSSSCILTLHAFIHT